MNDRRKQVVGFLTMIHHKEGNDISRENLEELDMIYGIHPGDDEEATADWIRDECEIAATEHEGAIYLNLATNGVLQLVRLKHGATKSQVIGLRDCIQV